MGDEKPEPQSEEEKLRSLIIRFREVSADMAKGTEDTAQRLATYRESLDARRSELDAREKGLVEREAKVKAREDSVSNIRQLAADRKRDAEVAREVADKADKARKNAEAETRLLKRDKDQLEERVAVLIREKQELKADLEKAVKPGEPAPEPVSASDEGGPNEG